MKEIIIVLIITLTKAYKMAHTSKYFFGRFFKVRIASLGNDMMNPRIFHRISLVSTSATVLASIYNSSKGGRSTVKWNYLIKI